MLKQDCSEHLTAVQHQKNKAWHLVRSMKRFLVGLQKGTIHLARGWDEQPGHWWVTAQRMIPMLRLGGDRHGIFPPLFWFGNTGDWLCCWRQGRGGRRFAPVCDRELQLLVKQDNLEHVPKHLWQQNPPKSFYNLQLEPSWLLCPPRATLPRYLGSLSWPLQIPIPLQHSWNSFPRWRQRKKTGRGKTLWPYQQNCPQKRKWSPQFSAQMGSCIQGHYIPYLWWGFFLQGIIRRKLVSSAEKLGKHQGRPVSLFHTAGFSAAQVFFPLALGPSKDECWISLSVTHRLICY